MYIVICTDFTDLNQTNSKKKIVGNFLSLNFIYLILQ
jgi:hypothetical protein